MPWGLWSSEGGSSGGKADDGASPPPPPKEPERPSTKPLSPLSPDATLPTTIFSPSTRERPKTEPISWNNSLNAIDWEHYREPRHWVPPLLAVATVVGALQFYRSYLKRFPGTNHISPGFFRRRSLLGKVTRVGDGDNFHLFHTPGGVLAGWGWLRRVPSARKDLKGRTIPIRLAGIDAPEVAHFGKPGQPYAEEALSFLQSYISGKRVRAYIYKRDQYERVVATVFLRTPPLFLRRDVGLEMLRRGLARTYEAKTGAEFGGELVEKKYHTVQEEARRKGRGLWAAEKPSFFGLGPRKEIESPGQYKARMRGQDKGDESKA
ncbi:SNase-domain-containing protein [Thozetella sp. PMI_491]|nr:SNase-domain-containing protein [Thozetella sp. PMI_491]